MKRLMVKYVIGNPIAPPWAVALTRAIFGAIIVSGLAALSAWSITDNPKEVIIPSLTTFLSYIGMRYGIEGVGIDQRKNGGK